METMGISKDYGSLVRNLMELVPGIYAVAVIEDGNTITYSTDNWDLTPDIESVCTSWDSQKAPFIMVSGVKYTMLECEVDSMVATSIRGEGHIVGCKDEERKIISYVEPEGDIKAAIVEISRILAQMHPKKEQVTPPTQYNSQAGSIDPQLKSEIENFLYWIKDPNGLQGHIQFSFQQNNTAIISELSKVYKELRQIFGV